MVSMERATHCLRSFDKCKTFATFLSVESNLESVTSTSFPRSSSMTACSSISRPICLLMDLSAPTLVWICWSWSSWDRTMNCCCWPLSSPLSLSSASRSLRSRAPSIGRSSGPDSSLACWSWWWVRCYRSCSAGKTTSRYHCSGVSSSAAMWSSIHIWSWSATLTTITLSLPSISISTWSICSCTFCAWSCSCKNATKEHYTVTCTVHCFFVSAPEKCNFCE